MIGFWLSLPLLWPWILYIFFIIVVFAFGGLVGLFLLQMDFYAHFLHFDIFFIFLILNMSNFYTCIGGRTKLQWLAIPSTIGRLEAFTSLVPALFFTCTYITSGTVISARLRKTESTTTYFEHRNRDNIKLMCTTCTMTMTWCHKGQRPDDSALHGGIQHTHYVYGYRCLGSVYNDS